MAIDIPQHVRASEAELLQTHVRARVAPAGLEHLACELAIPSAWASAAEFGPVPSGPLETRGLGFFASEDSDGAPTLALTATAVPYDIPIDAWARWLFECEGWTTLSASWFPGASGLFYDITGTRAGAGVQQVRRSAVSVVGSDIVMVNCQCALERWDDAKDDFWTAIATFEPAGKGATRMEPWVLARAADPSFEFAHPGSWLHESVAAKEAGVSAVDVRLPDADGTTLLAYLQVRAQALHGAPSPPLMAAETRSAARLEASGYSAVGSSTPLTPYDDPRAAAVAGWLGGFRGSGRLQGASVEALRGYVVRGDRLFTLLALSPPLPAHPLAWLRARRAWEIARATLTSS